MNKTNISPERDYVDCEKNLAREVIPIEYAKAKGKPLLTLRYKCLTKEGIICNRINEITFEESTPFYDLVSRIYHVLKKTIRSINFTSVELYSMTGYPLAISPCLYFQPISNWYLHTNELIYVYPKNLIKDYEHQSNVGVDFIVMIQLKNSEYTRELKLNGHSIKGRDIKIFLSMEIHIAVDNITIWHSDSIVQDDRNYVKKLLEKGNLLFSISETYNDNELSPFCTEYTSFCDYKSLEDFHIFNAHLLYLVREHRENGNNAKLLRNLGLLRKISCSPPLIYALYLLFTGSRTSLPHKVAINEGIITSISLFSSSTDLPNISKFCELWLHIEQHVSVFDLSATEIYETATISKQIRDNPKTDDQRRMLQAFPSNQDVLINWRNAPSTHDAFCYTPPNKLEDFTDDVETRFLQYHAVELYLQFLENGKSYGLIKPLIKDLKSICVFLGSTKYGYFNYFSPEDGICHTVNSWTNTVPFIGSSKISDEELNSYPLIIFILDCSRDMMGNNLTKNLVYNALIFINIFIDELIRTRYKYLFGAIVISDSHNFEKGFREIHSPSFEYQFIYEELKNTAEKIFYSTRKYKGILTKALKYIFNKYSRNNNKNVVNILTNSENNENSKIDIQRHGSNICLSENTANFTINSIIFEGKAHYINDSFKFMDGHHECLDNVKQHFYQSHDKNVYNNKEDMSLNYTVELLKKIIYPDNIRVKENYKSLLSKLSEHRIATLLEWLDEKNEDQSTYNKNIEGYTRSSWFQILKQITNFMKNPNPHCRIYSIEDNILKWLLVFEHRDVSNKSIIWLTKLQFEENYPHSPPNICCLTRVYHPNVTPSGKICHPILFEDYNLNVSLREIIDHLVELIVNPILSHAVEYEIVEILKWNKEEFSKKYMHCSEINLIPQDLDEVEADLNIKGPTFTPQHGILTCPLTKLLFTTPVTTPEGRTYEQSAILKYLKTIPRDPTTSNPLNSKQLIYNQAIASAVYKYQIENPPKLYWWEK